MYDSTPSLSSLTGVIEVLQETIRRDHATIGSNETRTRNALIDPILRELGWADPSVVTQEYLIRYGPGPSDYGVADYVLHPPGDRARPVAVIEAKRMGEELTDEHRGQALTYAFDKADSVTCLAVTNGDEWELYEILEDRYRRAFSLSIRGETAAHCAQTLISGFRMLIPDGVTVGPARSPAPDLALHDAGALAAGPEVLPPAEAGSALSVDTLKILTWLAVFLVVGTVAGYIAGFREADPQGGTFATIGMFVAAIAAIVVAVLARSAIGVALRGIVGALRPKRSGGDANGGGRGSLWWLGAAIVAGVFGGGLLGFVLGLETAQSAMDILADLGRIFILALIAAAVALVILVLALAAFRDPRGGSRGRRRGYSAGSEGRSWRLPLGNRGRRRIAPSGWARRPQRRNRDD